MKSRVQAVLLACLSLSLLSVLPAAAETFTVHLVDGGSILSRYQPQRAAWDPKTILVLGETGNWIGVAEDKVKNISSSLDKRGFGLRIDAKTIFLGWSANELDPNAPQVFEEEGAPSPSVEQFVEPGQSGSTSIPSFDYQPLSPNTVSSPPAAQPRPATPTPRPAPESTTPAESSAGEQ